MGYNPLLSEYDLQWMNDCIHETICSYHSTIIAYIPLPENRQPNFDKYLREFNGPILYYKKIIRAERVELVQDNTDSIPPEDIDYGRRDSGDIMYAIPDDIPIYDDHLNIHGYEKWRPDIFMVFQVNDSDDRYYVRSIRDRIGQCLLGIRKYDGVTPNGIDLKDILVIDDIDNINMDIAIPLYRKTKDEDNAGIGIDGALYRKTKDEDSSIISGSSDDNRNNIFDNYMAVTNIGGDDHD